MPRFNCIKALVDHSARLQLYQVHAVTEGTDAQANRFLSGLRKTGAS